MSLIDLLNRRHAVRRFSPGVADPAALDHAFRAAVLAPTSFNAQPWRAVLVEHPETRKAVAGAVYSSTNVGAAGHMVLFCHLADAAALDLDGHAARMADQRGLAGREALQKLRAGYARDIEGKPPQVFDAWAKAQTYLALGLFLAGAAEAGLDACPMEGFNPAALEDALGLAARGLVPDVLVTLGRSAEDDPAAHWPKLRQPADSLILRI
ncbi:nitroreductase family protein [Lutimaribacter sp. EGI FJ00015]|uniref:Nitroreductase family protein n=1 Tax=Lutimaribacter degradans TaxID=2945989 RepID=A0ACC5ZUT8_9RHOB|nr:nitroreductase family protein [Lutimaribacter sp. EGI FJ00013]MCM2561531.1 nitroreductase family protein [Lutimaribacter sp. EGI FJ00013]MCO0612758.1 nitroreductase family protein [Lutimaribacter sp. EGI FJ00015]MCO0635416.1 nitroreductase family protein [Lutimaribacter sp. EGI FJ00014]